jgi:hypothetical protein
VRFVAQVESVSAVTTTIRQRERPDGNGQRLKRCRGAVARGFAREHAGHVRFERDGRDRVASARAGHADAKWQIGGSRRPLRARSPERLRRSGHQKRRDQDNDAQAHVNPRNSVMSLQILGRLAMS